MSADHTAHPERSQDKMADEWAAAMAEAKPADGGAWPHRGRIAGAVCELRAGGRVGAAPATMST